MKISICGIPHEVVYANDVFDNDTHYGQIDYGKAVIKVSKDVSKEQQDEALCHEILHGILVHIGKNELSQDESFIQCLSNAIYQSFEPKFMRGEQDEID